MFGACRIFGFVFFFYDVLRIFLAASFQKTASIRFGADEIPATVLDFVLGTFKNVFPLRVFWIKFSYVNTISLGLSGVIVASILKRISLVCSTQA